MLGKSFEEMMKEKKVADFISGLQFLICKETSIVWSAWIGAKQQKFTGISLTKSNNFIQPN